MGGVSKDRAAHGWFFSSLPAPHVVFRGAPAAPLFRHTMVTMM